MCLIDKTVKVVGWHGQHCMRKMVCGLMYYELILTVRVELILGREVYAYELGRAEGTRGICSWCCMW
jgi:hypothetical protein